MTNFQLQAGLPEKVAAEIAPYIKYDQLVDGTVVARYLVPELLLAMPGKDELVCRVDKGTDRDLVALHFAGTVAVIRSFGVERYNKLQGADSTWSSEVEVVKGPAP